MFERLALQLNPFTECKRYGIPLWECPQFLFFVMGILIIISSIFSYVLGRRYIDDPQITALFILILTGVLLAITFIITQSFERLASANRLKSEFVGVVSHQLRSPLTNLRWGVDFLMAEGSKKTTEEDEYLLILKENMARMNELIEDLLAPSQLPPRRDIS